MLHVNPKWDKFIDDNFCDLYLYATQFGSR